MFILRNQFMQCLFVVFTVSGALCDRQTICTACFCQNSRISCENSSFNLSLFSEYVGPEITFIKLIGVQGGLLSNNSFAKFSNVTDLIMESNDIRIEYPILYPLINVKNISLRNNSIDDIHVSMFSSNHQLEILDLSENNIRVIKNNSFSNMSKLVNLQLRNNKLSSIEKKGFAKVKALKILDLSNNQLRLIQSGTFADLESLNVLILRDNILEFVGTEVFKGLQSLEELDASGNNLKHLVSNPFSSMRYLKILILRNNFIEDVREDSFTGLPSLEELDLSGNQLKRVNSSVFSSLTSLQVLLLRDNLLESLASGAFTGLVSLEELDVSANRLSRLDVQCLWPLLSHSLTLLRAGRNNITTLSPATVVALARGRAGFLRAQIDPNPLRCECGDLQRGWEMANAARTGDSADGGRLQLTCADGRPWDVALRGLRCDNRRYTPEPKRPVPINTTPAQTVIDGAKDTSEMDNEINLDIFIVVTICSFLAIVLLVTKITYVCYNYQRKQSVKGPQYIHL